MAQFIDTYGATILYTALTAIAGYVATLLKGWLNEKKKLSAAKEVVKMVEQVYESLDGEEKLARALDALAEILDAKGIRISALEARTIIEAAVNEFSNALWLTAQEEDYEDEYDE